MEQTEEYFTLETLAKFYADAAKAGGIEELGFGWSTAFNGPNLNSKVADYRPKPAPPIVKYVLKYPDGTTSRASFTFKEGAAAWQIGVRKNSKIIKLIEEV